MTAHILYLEPFLNSQIGEETLTCDWGEVNRKSAAYAFKMWAEHGIRKEKTLAFLQRKFVTE